MPPRSIHLTANANPMATDHPPPSAPSRVSIVIHDYSGHPGQVQLSRALAGRGHQVTHQHCPSYVTGKGAVEPLDDDPVALTFEPCPMDGEFKRYSPLKRVLQELSYGWRAGGLIASHHPDVAVLSNIPLLAHALVAARLRWRRIPMVFWHQDIYSAAISAATQRLGPVGAAIGWVADRIEGAIARSSAAIVAISPTFESKLRAWGVKESAIHVVPNWAPIEDLPVRAKDNQWSRRMGLASTPVVLYTGTLGLKHDPSILAAVADHLGTALPEARVVVISEGKGREWLESWKQEHGAENLLLLDYQPYPDLPEVMGTADLLVAILEPDASRYSVPSKVLTYLCAERAIVGYLPANNSIGRLLEAEGAGVVVDPAERQRIGPVVTGLLGDEKGRCTMGQAGRGYAEVTFSPDAAADRFEAVFASFLTR